MNCLDAETLAAWFDDGLSSAALEDVRSHVAGCARCQALVGAMGRTRAAAPAPEPERGPKWWLAWAVPAAAAATAVAIWVAVPRPTNVAVNSSPASTLEKKEAPAEATPAVPPPRAATPALRDLARSADAAATPPATPPPSENDATKQAAGNVNETLSVRAAAPAPTAAAERREQTERQDAIVGQLQARDAFASSPCGPMWPAPPSDVAAQITAGSSPSGDVCWIVGRAGTVLRSTDRQTWQRVTFPVPVDLSRINATDPRSATVVTMDNRTFSTADGGMTWTQQ